MRIGILSDTHDKVLPALFFALEGVAEILHAGDVCRDGVLAELGVLAPVTAVHGNCDARELVERLPAERRLERGGIAIHLLHGHQAGRANVERIARLAGPGAPASRAAGGAADVVVFGHSHEACDEVRDGVRYFNPGTAGGVRYAPTVGILTIADGGYTLEHVELRRG